MATGPQSVMSMPNLFERLIDNEPCIANGVFIVSEDGRKEAHLIIARRSELETDPGIRDCLIFGWGV